MSVIRAIFTLLIFVVSFPTFGSPVMCEDTKIFDETVSNKEFGLYKTGEDSKGIQFNVELKKAYQGSNLKDVILFKSVGDEIEYLFNLKYVDAGLKQSYVATGFTISHQMIMDAELMAVFDNRIEDCTTVIRKYRTKI